MAFFYHLLFLYLRHFGGVERVIIEEPNEPRTPQYAAIIFGSFETLLRVLKGKEKVKFTTGEIFMGSKI